MPLVDISRWQFGVTTVYHFLFVPLTIGMSLLVAIMQTFWVVTNKPLWYQGTKFFGKLFLVNFALGVATGLVQEFQFGMNWSEYSRYVGDVFGVPLALEALVAFFMESTFIGLWIFGWGRLPKKVHLAAMWMVTIGVHASAYFIIAANSFMQHPVGAKLNPVTHRLELVSIWQVLTNVTTLVAFPHTVMGSWLTAGTFVVGISGIWMVKEYYKNHSFTADGTALSNSLSDSDQESDRASGDDSSLSLWRPLFRFGLYVIIGSGILLGITGDLQGKIMFQQQPMKMASAESLCEEQKGASFSVLTVGTHANCNSIKRLIVIPRLTSFLATNSFNSTLPGVHDMEKHYTAMYGPGNYRPNLFVTYWTFRFMIGWALGSAGLAVAGLWLDHKKKVSSSRWFARLCLIAIPTPFFANSCGWIFTEMGRGPWVVVPNLRGDLQIKMQVSQAVSSHPISSVIISLVVFCLLYGILVLIWLYLQVRCIVQGPDPYHDPYEHSIDSTSSHEAIPQLSFAY